MSADEKDSYTPGDVFHAQKQPVYAGTHGFAVNKKAEHMAKVVYEAPHFNLREPVLRKGAGRDFATRIFSEEGEQAERLFSTPLELMMDARLEPFAAIGLHSHEHTEQVYYVLEGRLRMTTVDSRRGEHTVELGPADAHLVKLGQGHHGQALDTGARFIVVAVRKGWQTQKESGTAPPIVREHGAAVHESGLTPQAAPSPPPSPRARGWPGPAAPRSTCPTAPAGCP